MFSIHHCHGASKTWHSFEIPAQEAVQKKPGCLETNTFFIRAESYGQLQIMYGFVEFLSFKELLGMMCSIQYEVKVTKFTSFLVMIKQLSLE